MWLIILSQLELLCLYVVFLILERSVGTKTSGNISRYELKRQLLLYLFPGYVENLLKLRETKLFSFSQNRNREKLDIKLFNDNNLQLHHFAIACYYAMAM